MNINFEGDLLHLIINIFESVMFVFFPTVILRSKVRKINQVFYSVVFFIIIMMLLNLYKFLGISQNIVIIFAITIYSKLSLRGSFRKKLSISLICVFSTSTIISLCIYLTGIIFKIESNLIFTNGMYNTFATILSHIFVLITLIILSYCIIKIWKLNNKQWLMISVLFVVSEIANALMIYYTNFISIPYEQLFIFFGISLCIFCVAILGFVIIGNFSNENRLILENQLLKNEKIFQEKNLELIENSNRKIATIKHDLKAYISSISVNISQNKFQEALMECKKITGDLDKIEIIIDCNSPIINLIISEKIKECTQKNISIKCSVIKNLFVDEQNFVVVFSNLMNNAIEHCEKLDENNREIEINIFEKIGHVVIQIKNTIVDSVLNDNKNLETTKIDMKNHGIGHKTIEKIMSRNKGYINYYEDNNKFISEAIFIKN